MDRTSNLASNLVFKVCLSISLVITNGAEHVARMLKMNKLPTQFIEINQLLSPTFPFSASFCQRMDNCVRKFKKAVWIGVGFWYMQHVGVAAQTSFYETLGGSTYDSGASVIETRDGGLIIVGETVSYGEGSYDILLVKYDAYGTFTWAKTVGGTGDDEGNSVIETSDGGLVVTGTTTTYGEGGYDIFLGKFSSDGTLSWAKTFGGSGYEEGYSVIESSDGGLVVTGQTTSFGEGGYDIFLGKFGSDGTLYWFKTLGGTNHDYSNSVIESSDGGFVITGSTMSYTTQGSDLLVAKFASDGTFSWARTLNGGYYNDGYSVIESSDGELVITGDTLTTSAGRQIVLAKFTSSGVLTWSKTLGGSYDDYGHSVIQSSDGGLVITGYTASYGSGGDDVLLAKFTSDGVLTWAKALGGKNNEIGYSVIQTKDGRFVTTGAAWSAPTGYYGIEYDDVLLTKSGNGTADCTISIIGLESVDTSFTQNSISPIITSPSVTTIAINPITASIVPDKSTGCLDSSSTTSTSSLSDSETIAIFVLGGVGFGILIFCLSYCYAKNIKKTSNEEVRQTSTQPKPSQVYSTRTSAPSQHSNFTRSNDVTVPARVDYGNAYADFEYRRRQEEQRQLLDQAKEQLKEEIKNVIVDPLAGRLGGQIGDQIGNQLGGQVGGQIGNQLGSQMAVQVADAVVNRFVDKMVDPSYNQQAAFNNPYQFNQGFNTGFNPYYNNYNNGW